MLTMDATGQLVTQTGSLVPTHQCNQSVGGAETTRNLPCQPWRQGLGPRPGQLAVQVLKRCNLRNFECVMTFRFIDTGQVAELKWIGSRNQEGAEAPHGASTVESLRIASLQNQVGGVKDALGGALGKGLAPAPRLDVRSAAFRA